MQTRECLSLSKESWIMPDLSWLFINTSLISWKVSSWMINFMVMVSREKSVSWDKSKESRTFWKQDPSLKSPSATHFLLHHTSRHSYTPQPRKINENVREPFPPWELRSLGTTLLLLKLHWFFTSLFQFFWLPTALLAICVSTSHTAGEKLK